MAKGIPDKKRRDVACKKETLEDAVECLLEEYDLGGANPYTSQGGKYTLVQLVSWLEEHDELKNKTQRRQNDILRNVLNEMMSILRVGSTKNARYAFDTQGGGLEAREMLNRVLRALLLSGGNLKWTELQETLKIDEVGGMTHQEFNSAVNYLVDNGVAIKKGSRAERVYTEKGPREIRPDSRRVVSTAKAWGWETGLVAYSGDKNMMVISGSTKKTLTITLTELTTKLLDEVSQILDTLPDTDKRRPAHINRSTIVEVALWTLRREIQYVEGQSNDRLESTQELAQLLVDRLMANELPD